MGLVTVTARVGYWTRNADRALGHEGSCAAERQPLRFYASRVVSVAAVGAMAGAASLDRIESDDSARGAGTRDR